MFRVFSKSAVVTLVTKVIEGLVVTVGKVLAKGIVLAVKRVVTVWTAVTVITVVTAMNVYGNNSNVSKVTNHQRVMVYPILLIV